MIVSLAQKKDAPEIARIHKAEISGGFLSSLSIAFLTLFYEAIITSPVSFCVAAKENNEVVGFTAGTVDMHAFYNYFLSHYFLQSCFILLPKLFSSFKKIMETLLYPAKGRSLPKAELLTIAVVKKFQGKGVGGLMLPVFNVEMKKRKVATFKVVVGQFLAQAVAFYEKNNFVFAGNIIIHGKSPSRVYLYNL